MVDGCDFWRGCRASCGAADHVRCYQWPNCVPYGYGGVLEVSVNLVYRTSPCLPTSGLVYDSFLTFAINVTHAATSCLVSTADLLTDHEQDAPLRNRYYSLAGVFDPLENMIIPSVQTVLGQPAKVFQNESLFSDQAPTSSIDIHVWRMLDDTLNSTVVLWFTPLNLLHQLHVFLHESPLHHV